jgi:hypothetical protein
MRKIVNWTLKAGFVFLLAACTSIPTNSSSLRDSGTNSSAQQAEDAAANALAILQNGGSSPSSGTSGTKSGSSSPAASNNTTNNPQTQSKAGVPAWVSSKDSVYNKNAYISAVGFASDQTSADKKALADITSYFGQSIQADMRMMSSYSEAVSKGTVTVSESVQTQEAIRTSSQLDSLIGAEIADRYYDNRGTYYAVAIMDKAKTAKIYTDIINANVASINSLISIKDKYTFDGYLNYQMAAKIADANQAYVNVLSVIGDASSIRASLKKGDDYRNEAKSDIAPKIPIAVTVSGDVSNRIKNAFSESITKAGFRTGGTDSRYTLRVNFSLSEVTYPGNDNKFSSFLVDSRLLDRKDNTELFPFNATGREGALTFDLAKTRATAAAEKTIADPAKGFGKKLSDYLSSL